MKNKLKYASNNEFYEALRPLVSLKQAQSKKQLSMQSVLEILIESGEMKRLERSGKQSVVPCMTNFDSQSIEKGYEAVALHLVGMGSYYNFVYPVDITELEKKYAYVIEVNHLKEYAKMPKHVLHVSSGLYDLAHKKFINDRTDSQGNEYYLSNSVNYDIVKLEQVDQTMLKVVQKIFDDWSQGDATRLNFLKSLVLAAAMGEGFEKYVIIQGPSGSGKSTFLDILKGVVGARNSLRCNMQALKTDSYVSLLHNELNVILGDDLDNSRALSNSLRTRIEKLATCKDILVNRKYLTPAYIRMEGLKIQATDEFPRFLESNSDMLDYVIVCLWANVNYRHDEDSKEWIRNLTGHSLDELIYTGPIRNNKYAFEKHTHKFYTALMSWVVHTTLVPSHTIFEHFQKTFRKELKRV